MKSTGSGEARTEHNENRRPRPAANPCLNHPYPPNPMLRKLLQLYNRLPGVRERRDIRASLWNIEQGLQAQLAMFHRFEAQLTGGMIRLLDFDLEHHPRYGDPRRLLRYQTQVCSQNAEDGILHEIFRRIGTTNRVFAEVGVGNGRENNTAFLLSQGWTGFWLDADDAFLQALANRPDLPPECLKHLVAFVSRENIAALFAQLGVPRDFDLLSLDIDQNTYYAWEGLAGFRPRVVVAEYNAALPPDVVWKVRYDPRRICDGSQNYSASLKAYELLGRQFGYSLVGCDFLGLNAFFVRDDLLGDHFAGPFTAENHYEPPRYPMLHRRSHAAGILDRLDPHS